MVAKFLQGRSKVKAEEIVEHPTEIEDLLKLADEIVGHYLTTEASERARSSYNLGSGKRFVQGTWWNNLNIEAQVT
jgi:hypothetical protein